MKNGWDMPAKTPGDEYLHKTWKKTIFLALLVLGAIFLSAVTPASAEGTPTSVLLFTDKKTYMGWWVSPNGNPPKPGYSYAGVDTAPLVVYVYAMVLNEKGIILKGKEGQLSGFVADYKRETPGQANGHHTEIFGETIFGNQTLTFVDDGSLPGDEAGDGIYVAKLTLDKTKGSTLIGDHEVMNVTVSFPGIATQTQQVLITGWYCMNGVKSGAGHGTHANTAGKYDNCAVCHHGYEHWFENISKTFSDDQLDIHAFKVNPPDVSSTYQSTNAFVNNRWNWSDAGGSATASTFEQQVPGSKYCAFCHEVLGSATYDYDSGKRDILSTNRPTCNNTNCHHNATTEISNTTVPSWNPAALAVDPSTTTRNTRAMYNITQAQQHAHDSTGTPTVPCVSCHRTTHSFQLPNRTSTDYTDLANRCLSCHTLFNKHNSSVSCIKCHTNDTHNIRFLQNDTSYNWSKTNIVACDNCHTNASFGPSLGLNPPQVPYTNHSSDNDAGQKWGDYWTSKNQQNAVGGSNLISSTNINVTSESVVTGTTTGVAGAWNPNDGSNETLTEGLLSVPPTNIYSPVTGNNTIQGTITNWAAIQNFSDNGAYGTYTDNYTGAGWKYPIVNGNFSTDLSTWNTATTLTAAVNWWNSGRSGGSVNVTDTVNEAATANITQSFDYLGNSTPFANLTFAYYAPSTNSVATGSQWAVYLTKPDGTKTKLWSATIPNGAQAWTTVNLSLGNNISRVGTYTLDLSVYYAGSGGAHALNVSYDDVKISINSTNAYVMDIQNTFINTPPADNYYLQGNYSVVNDTYSVWIYNGSVWNNRTVLNSSTFALLNLSLTSNEYNSGSPQIEITDNDNNVTKQGKLNLDYLRIYGWTADTSHQEITLYHNFTGIPKYRAKETAVYTVTVKGNVTANENLDIYVYAYDSNEYELVKDHAFSTTNDWVNWTIPYEAIGDTGTASIQFRDSNRTRYDNVQDKFYLDYVGIKADSYKYLPCYYCHALLANHKAKALGNILNVQNGNEKNSTNLSGYWCANCHYNGSVSFGTYKYNGSAWSPVPPLINFNNVNNNSASWYNHSDIVSTNFTDAKCKECHGTAAIQTTKQFPHTIEIGSSGGANCTNCHNAGGSAGTGRLVNFTAMNDSLAIHKNLNSGATTSLPAENKKCWACHGNGSEPGSGHPSNYKTPYKCVDCHVPGVSQNLNFTPSNTLLNVTQHYWNGTNITTTNATSCYACHNRTEMMLGNSLDPDGAAGVYGGANGGNNSTSHYGKKRTDMTGWDTTTYCTYCHNTTTNNVTFYVSDFNNTIFNHTPRATTPLCTTCHYNGRIHNSTLAKPVSNDSFCSTCHGTGGTAATNNKSEHKTLYCTECHANSTAGTLAGKDIHAIKYLTQSNTFATSNSSAVNCVTCHQTTSVDSSLVGFTAFKIKNPMRHSDNISNGSVWDSYWTNTTPQQACVYCHNDTKHNATPLGRILQWNQNYNLYGSIGSNGSCADCHYKGDLNYTQMNSAFVSAGLKVPPEITNGTNWKGNSSNYYNHSLDAYDDQTCKSCHGSLLSASANMSEFLHNVAVGVAGGANCTNCHNIGGTAGTGKLVNISAMNDTNSIHKNLNSNAQASDANYSVNKKCWACHGNGSEPGSGHPSNYKTPYRCVDCHVSGVGQNMNFTPQSILNVTQHYWNGTSINTSAATSCYACHNKSEMMIGLGLDPDGAAGVYGGANGGSNSTSHYGRKRTDYPAQGTNDYCYKCHNNASATSVFPYSNTTNATIANHSLSYPSTNPACASCHDNVTQPGRIHNSTVYKPAFALPNSSYCLACHGSGGSATIKNLERHNSTTGLNCTQCHLNSTDSIHPVRYLQQSSAWDTIKTNAVNCTTCHQGSGLSGFTSAPKVPVLNHSTNTYSGALWNNTQSAYWTNTSQQASCDYCHGKIALHNNSGLGNITIVKGSNTVKQNLSTSTWCANCHYKGASGYAGSSFYPEPPEILNASGKVPLKASDNTNFYNHSQDMATGYNDSKCKNCHNNALDANATSLNFSHNVAPGGGGANCTSCHYIGASVQNINITAMNYADYIHKDLNKNATASDNGYNESKKCWACHSEDGKEPSGHPTRYKTPYNCTDCHVQGAGQNFNYTPNNTILNVTQHYWNGNSIRTPNATSCYACHNTSEMITPAFDPDGASSNVYSGANGGNDSTSHYGRKRSSDYPAQGTNDYCYRCHNNASATSVFPYSNPSNATIANHSSNYNNTNPPCKDCHSTGRIHNSTLYKPASPIGNSTYCLSCHGLNTSSGGTNYSGAVTGIKDKHNGSVNCAQCHLNDSRSIHPVRYLKQDGSNWSESNTSAVNCTNCHQTKLTNFSTAPIIPDPLNHSSNLSNGSIWGTYWTSEEGSCYYCHNNTKHNTTALGRINSLLADSNNTRNGSLTTTTWCADCHYNTSNSYYNGSQWNPVPPLITINNTGKSNWKNHSGYLSSGYKDSNCNSCHALNGTYSSTSLNYSHSLDTGVEGGPNCISCHYVGSSYHNINVTALNLSVHFGVNSVNSTANGACWACHDSTGNVTSGMGDHYNNPYNCTACHLSTGEKSGAYGARLVTNHYKNGTNITSRGNAASDIQSCIDCHENISTMLVYNNDSDTGSFTGDGINVTGGASSFYHYGKNRTSFGSTAGSTAYCIYCHNNSTGEFAGVFLDSASTTIQNHSSYTSTPGCDYCHNSTGTMLHDTPIVKPSFTLNSSNYCLSCHGLNTSSGGTNYTGAVTGIKDRHNNSVNCTQCHTNSTRSIHPVRYLQHDGSTWNTSKANAVNCTTCHQGSGLGGSFISAPLVQTPIWHSNSSYAGTLWNSTPGYWDNNSQQSSCDYCHGKPALHNSSGLGNTTSIQANNSKNQSLAGGYWCANCHYNGKSPGDVASGKYNYKGDSFYPVPPEILNFTGLMPANSSDGTPFQNHTINIASDWSDARCKSCHGKDLPTDTTSATFLHRLNQSQPESGGPDCLKCHPSTANEPNGPPPDKRVNATAFTNYSVHKDLNKNATNTTQLTDIRSKACWACHGDGTEPVKHPIGYTNPKPCEYCHRDGVTDSSLFNAPNVTKHRPGSVFAGMKIHSTNYTEGSCQICHNNSIVFNNNITATLNATVSHYATNTSLKVTDLPNSCAECHVGVTTYGVPKQLTDQARHSMNGACQASCHNPNYKNATAVNPVILHNASLDIAYRCYVEGCHANVPSRPPR